MGKASQRIHRVTTTTATTKKTRTKTKSSSSSSGGSTRCPTCGKYMKRK